MLVASYNRQEMGDILVVILHQDSKQQDIQYKDNVVRIYNPENNLTLGYNFLNASKIIPELNNKRGQIVLNNNDVNSLNNVLNKEQLKDLLSTDLESNLVVGYVKSIKSHPDSDHLKIAKVQVDNNKVVQIVSGSPNMKENIKVVVAKVGTMMPNGMIIWPGKLKGIESDGMMCAGYELNLPNAPQKPGALILPDSYQIGDTFNINKEQNLFK